MRDRGRDRPRDDDDRRPRGRGPGERPPGDRGPRRFERGDRPFDRGDRPFDRGGQRPFQRRDDRPSGPRPFQRRDDRPFDRDESSRSGGDRPYAPRGDRPGGGGRPFAPRGDRSSGGRPFDTRGDRPFPRRPYGGGDEPGDGESAGKSGGGDRPPFERQPFDRPRRQFDRPPRPYERRPRFDGPPDRPRPPSSPPADTSGLIGEGEEVVAGRRPVSEAFAARRAARRLLVVPDRRAALEALVLHATTLRLPIVEVEGGTLTALTGFDGHQGIALVVAERAPATVQEMLTRAARRGEAPFLLVLDSLEDPQNLGTLLRSAEACGVHGVIYPSRHAAPLTAAAIKSSAGASEHLLLAAVDNLPGTLADLRSSGLRLVGADEGAPLKYSEADLRGPLALVVGSEERGISGSLRRRLDLTVRIPMRGQVASLNAAVAGSVLLFAAADQRGVAETGDRAAELDLGVETEATATTAEAGDGEAGDAEPAHDGDAVADAIDAQSPIVLDAEPEAEPAVEAPDPDAEPDSEAPAPKPKRTSARKPATRRTAKAAADAEAEPAPAAGGEPATAPAEGATDPGDELLPGEPPPAPAETAREKRRRSPRK